VEQKSTLQRLWEILRWLVPLGLIGFLLSRVDWAEILPLLSQISWTSLLLSALAFLLSQIVIAVRWQYLLRLQDIRLPLVRLIWLVLIGAFVSNFLPTTIGGDIVKMVAVTRGQTKRATAVASVVADRLFNLAAMFFWLPFTFSLQGGNLPAESGGTLASGLMQIPFIEKMWSRLVRVFKAGRVWFISPRCVVVALLLSWLSIGLSFLSFWILTLALNIPVSFWGASAVAVISYFAALIPVSVNGLGLLEGSVTALLVTQGASYEQGLAAALLVRLVTMAVSLLGGARLLGWRDLLTEASARGRQIGKEY
jgi:glycosyltransferase 2 family protein